MRLTRDPGGRVEGGAQAGRLQPRAAGADPLDQDRERSGCAFGMFGAPSFRSAALDVIDAVLADRDEGFARQPLRALARDEIAQAPSTPVRMRLTDRPQT